jgi:hypothetical protein
MDSLDHVFTISESDKAKAACFLNVEPINPAQLYAKKAGGDNVTAASKKIKKPKKFDSDSHNQQSLF